MPKIGNPQSLNPEPMGIHVAISLSAYKIAFFFLISTCPAQCTKQAGLIEKAIIQYLCCSVIQALSPVCSSNPVLKAEEPIGNKYFDHTLYYSTQVISQTFTCIYFTKAVVWCWFCDAQYRVKNK